MEIKTDYETESTDLILEQLKRQAGDDSESSTGGIPDPAGGMTAVVAFPAFSFTSAVIPFVATPASVAVEWSAGQQNKGALVYGVEYIITGNAIELTDGTGSTVDWTPTVQANALGLLNVTVTVKN